MELKEELETDDEDLLVYRHKVCSPLNYPAVFYRKTSVYGQKLRSFVLAQNMQLESSDCATGSGVPAAPVGRESLRRQLPVSDISRSDVPSATQYVSIAAAAFVVTSITIAILVYGASLSSKQTVQAALK